MRAPKTPALVRQCWPTIAFSSTVMLGKNFTFWNVRAMPSVVTWLGSLPSTDSPWNSTSPPSGLYEPRDDVEHGALARPVGPDHRYDLMLVHMKIQLVQRVEASEVLRDAGYLEQRAHVERVPPAGWGDVGGVFLQQLLRPLVLRALVLLQLPAPSHVGDQALRTQQHDRDQRCSVDQQPEVLELREQSGQADQHQRPHDDTGDRAQAAKDDDGERRDRDQDPEAGDRRAIRGSPRRAPRPRTRSRHPSRMRAACSAWWRCPSRRRPARPRAWRSRLGRSWTSADARTRRWRTDRRQGPGSRSGRDRSGTRTTCRGSGRS